MCRVFLANKAQVLDIPAFTVTPVNTILVNRNGIFVTIKRWQDDLDPPFPDSFCILS